MQIHDERRTCGSVASWNCRARMGSSARLNWSSHRNSNRASDSSSSRAAAVEQPLARSAECAAILYAMTPCMPTKGTLSINQFPLDCAHVTLQKPFNVAEAIMRVCAH